MSEDWRKELEHLSWDMQDIQKDVKELQDKMAELKHELYLLHTLVVSLEHNK